MQSSCDVSRRWRHCRHLRSAPRRRALSPAGPACRATARSSGGIFSPASTWSSRSSSPRSAWPRAPRACSILECSRASTANAAQPGSSPHRTTLISRQESCTKSSQPGVLVEHAQIAGGVARSRHRARCRRPTARSRRWIWSIASTAVVGSLMAPRQRLDRDVDDDAEGESRILLDGALGAHGNRSAQASCRLPPPHRHAAGKASPPSRRSRRRGKRISTTPPVRSASSLSASRFDRQDDRRLCRGAGSRAPACRAPACGGRWRVRPLDAGRIDLLDDLQSLLTQAPDDADGPQQSRGVVHQIEKGSRSRLRFSRTSETVSGR